MSQFSSSSAFMQTDSVDVWDTTPSKHFILHFPFTKFHSSCDLKGSVLDPIQVHLQITVRERGLKF